MKLRNITTPRPTIKPSPQVKLFSNKETEHKECQYCGGLNELKETKCSNCGAPIKK